MVWLLRCLRCLRLFSLLLLLCRYRQITLLQKVISCRVCWGWNSFMLCTVCTAAQKSENIYAQIRLPAHTGRKCMKTLVLMVVSNLCLFLHVNKSLWHWQLSLNLFLVANSKFGNMNTISKPRFSTIIRWSNAVYTPNGRTCMSTCHDDIISDILALFARKQER